MKKQLPIGVQDFLPVECFNKKTVEKQLLDVFFSYGYDEISPAAIDYYDNFTGGVCSAELKNLFKFSDSDGSLLVLRPDPTLQIAGIFSDRKITGSPERVCYALDSFEFSMPADSGFRSREFAQCGVELLGDTGCGGTAEVICLAIDALNSAGLSGFQIELGQTAFVKGLLGGIAVKEEDKSRLFDCIRRKDAFSLNTILCENGLSGRNTEALRDLPLLFGGGEVIDRAKAGCTSLECLNAIEDLNKVYGILCERGYEKYITLDLGLVHNFDYYSGVVFRGFSGSLGSAILQGGRYDFIAEGFGAQINAVGFSIGIKNLLVALERQGKIGGIPQKYCAYILKDGSGVDFIKKLRAEGNRCVQYFGDADGLKLFCKEKNIPRAFILENEVETLYEEIEVD